MFAHEGSVGAENLHPVSSSVAHIDQTVIGRLCAVNWPAENVRARLTWSVGIIGVVVDVRAAVRAPVTLERTGRHIDHCNPLVDVAVGEVGFTGVFIDGDFGNAAKCSCTVAVEFLAGHSDRSDVFAVPCENQHVRIRTAVATDPDVAVGSDFDAVV